MMPLIKVQIEGIRHSVVHAFKNFNLEVEKELQSSLEKIVTAEAVKELIEAEVASVIKQVIQEEARAYYQYGEGRKLISKLVIEKLTKDAL